MSNKTEILNQMALDEEEAVRELGQRIGYGRVIQLCERLWGEMLPGGLSPAAHATHRLASYDEREPLVRELVEACADCCSGSDAGMLEHIADSFPAVRDFKVTAQ